MALKLHKGLSMQGLNTADSIHFTRTLGESVWPVFCGCRLLCNVQCQVQPMICIHSRLPNRTCRCFNLDYAAPGMVTISSPKGVTGRCSIHKLGLPWGCDEQCRASAD